MEKELYENLGFKKNPFSTFSAEEEVDFIDDIFISPLYLKSLKEDISNGHSRFILGARGVGKTSLIYQLKSYCNDNEIFSIIVDDYEGIAKNKNKSGFLRLIIEVLLRDYCIALAKQPELVKKLKFESKEKLAFLIKQFFRTLSKSEYENHYNRVTNFKRKNFLKNVYNYLFNKPVNILVSGVVEIVSDTVRSSLGLPDPSSEKYYKTYFPSLETDIPSQEKINSKLKSDDKGLKNILEDLCILIEESGLKKPVIFFDKIDEYPILSSNITLIATFVEDTLKDTALLLNSNFSLVFSIWDAIKPPLTSKGTRFDKIKPLDVTWSNKQLSEILDKRLEYFSKNTIYSTDLIVNQEQFNSIIALSSNSPRYMLRLFSVVYDQQNNVNHESSIFEFEIVKSALLNYSKTFDFYAVFPGKRGTKDDVMTSVNRLLKIGKKEITTKDFVAIFKVSTQAALNYIKTQQGYGLINRIGNADGKTYLYEVKHPVIKYLIDNRVDEIAA